MRRLVVGSWTRALVTAAVLVTVWAAVAWLAVTGRVGELRYLNVPLVHPYPPAGYVQNPFDPSDRGDLISVSEFARVKADLLRDGQIELQALEVGDPTMLDNAATGRAKERLAALIGQNNSAGVFEREQMNLTSILVGRLSDPNDPVISWAVQEQGTTTISYYSKVTNAVVRRQEVKGTARFWLLKVGDRYLIADVLISPEST